MWNINAPQGRIPCEIFTKFAEFVPRLKRGTNSFQDALAVKISLDLLKGLWSYGGFKLTGSWLPQIFSAPLAAKLCVRRQKFYRCKNVLRSSVTIPSLVRLGFRPPSGLPKTFVCLSDCLFLQWDPNNVTYCRILPTDKTTRWLVQTTLCRQWCCCLADQLWLLNAYATTRNVG